ncbi:MAG TPA: MFS transporter [Pyrinomonadaceae bacterium]|nr:MFS transporter [Pyrinomonadaceae bacterium]
MNAASKRIVRTYVSLTVLSTFASSFIWGINTLFLLDAGLTITEAFAANAFFTAGEVLFEVPTGVIADTRGRRMSFLCGTATLFLTTLAYLWLWKIKGPFVGWAIVSMLLGLGFTFFSGATEAWLVDGLKAAKYDGALDNVFAKGSIANGVAMLTGTVAGGLVAQYTNLGVPYIMRIVALAATFLIAFFLMHDEGFEKKARSGFLNEVKDVIWESIEFGLKNRPVRWMMLSAIFNGGVGIFAFYAMQPYLLKLYGDPSSYAVAGVSATIVAGALIAGGFLVPYVGKLFAKRTSLLIAGLVVGVPSLVVIGLVPNFWVVLSLLAVWSLVFSVTGPIRQAYMNGIIPSGQRATVLSADNMLTSVGGSVSQPGLGKVAEVWGYPMSYLGSAAFQVFALPFLLLTRRENAASDRGTSVKR